MKEAGALIEMLGADFVITGEVLGSVPCRDAGTCPILSSGKAARRAALYTRYSDFKYRAGSGGQDRGKRRVLLALRRVRRVDFVEQLRIR
jgi:hypothetical protein